MMIVFLLMTVVLSGQGEISINDFWVKSRGIEVKTVSDTLWYKLHRDDFKAFKEWQASKIKTQSQNLYWFDQQDAPDNEINTKAFTTFGAGLEAISAGLRMGANLTTPKEYTPTEAVKANEKKAKNLRKYEQWFKKGKISQETYEFLIREAMSISLEK